MGLGVTLKLRFESKSTVRLLGICFWRKGREERIWAEYMGEKGGYNGNQWLTAHNPRTKDHESGVGGQGFSLINFTGLPPQVSPQPFASGFL